jgi:cell division protein FtsL
VVRLNLILLTVLTVCAIGLVSTQHRARKLFAELEREQESARQLDVEFGQLQLEQSTWAMHARVQKIATQVLHMRVLDARRIQLVQPARKSGTTGVAQ